jgi:transcriptional regulator with XRE-family HTH domain
MARRGAKGKYEQQVKPYLAEINKKVREGVTEEQIAKALGISVASLNNYKRDYPELKEALSKDKGADVLQDLVNAGLDAAKGSYKTNTQIVYVPDPNDPDKLIIEKVIENKVWQAPNASLHKMYVFNYGKEEGYTNDPLEYALKKARQEAQQKVEDAKNWHLNIDNKE